MSSEKNKEYQNVWAQFMQGDDKNFAICKICNKKMACKGSSTTGLHRHLQGKHGMKIRARTVEENLNTKHKCNSADYSITKYLTGSNRETLEEIVSKLAAFDNIPVQKITNCEFIRSSLKLRGFDLPKHPTDVMNLIYKYCDEIEDEVRTNINLAKAKKQKFSQSIDEWTSFRNRRYLNVHIYYENGDSDNLGLIRIHGSCSAEKMIDLVKTKLDLFKIDFEKDIVATTSDGASVMTRFGSLSPAILQLCYNHAIHIAVMNVFYSKIKPTGGNICVDDNENEDQLELDLFSEEEETESNTDINELIDDSNNIYSTIKQIRVIVKKFKCSPARNSVLMKHVITVEKTELQLLLDCKTRWNSLVTMIERFLRLIEPIKKALIDLNLEHLWENTSTISARNILKALKPVQIAVEALSRRDTNLLSSEGILKFLFSSLEENDSILSTNLLHEIQIQISKRRNVPLVSLLKFLNNPNCLTIGGSSTDFFKINSKTELVKSAKSLMKRLFVFNEDILNENRSNIDAAGEDSDMIVVENNSLTLKQKLEISINSSLATDAIKNDVNTVLKEVNYLN